MAKTILIWILAIKYIIKPTLIKYLSFFKYNINIFNKIKRVFI